MAGTNFAASPAGRAGHDRRNRCKAATIGTWEATKAQRDHRWSRPFVRATPQTRAADRPTQPLTFRQQKMSYLPGREGDSCIEGRPTLQRPFGANCFRAPTGAFIRRTRTARRTDKEMTELLEDASDPCACDVQHLCSVRRHIFGSH